MRRLVILVLSLIVLGGCTTSRHVSRRSSLMSYLYPSGAEAPPPNANVRLQLPLRLGIAFVPPDSGGPYRGDFRSLFPPDSETRLLSIVKKSFASRDWVGDIVMIPSSYLTARGGFENLEQVAHLMNVDVIALASLDQLQVSNPRRASFLYISVIGAYVLPLDRNETRTLIDAAVFHVPSHAFILRAPGISSITGSSTAVDIDAKLEERSVKGFELAMKDLAKNLNGEVDAFKNSVATGERKDVDIITREGRSVRGGGAFGGVEAVLAMLIALWTCHLMHWNWPHALLNAIAALPPVILLRGQIVRFALIAAPLIALAVHAGFDGEYRGASGLVMAMWVYAGIATNNRVLLIAAAAKLAAEALGLTPAHEGYVTVPLAHYAGAVVGLLGGLYARGRVENPSRIARHFAGFDSSIPETVMESSAASPLTVTSWPRCFLASSWLSSL